MTRRINKTFLVSIAILAFPVLVNADQINLTDRVIFHVNVRQQPTSECGIVGILSVGENAKLIDSVDPLILTIHAVYDQAINAACKVEIRFVHDWIINQVASDSNPEKNIIFIGYFNAYPGSQPHHFNDIIAGRNQYSGLLDEPLQAGEPPLRKTIQRTDNPGFDYFKSPVYALLYNPMSRAGNDFGNIEFDNEELWQQLGVGR